MYNATSKYRQLHPALNITNPCPGPPAQLKLQDMIIIYIACKHSLQSESDSGLLLLLFVEKLRLSKVAMLCTPSKSEMGILRTSDKTKNVQGFVQLPSLPPKSIHNLEIHVKGINALLLNSRIPPTPRSFMG